jgi:chromate reductase
MPPVLKNALDIASRPYGKNAWAGKPGAIISVSPGKQGAFGANHHLRQVMAFLDIRLMNQPEVYIGEVASLLNEQGEIGVQGTKDFLKSASDAFAKWVSRFR